MTARARASEAARRIATARDDALERPVHDDRSAAILGIALGVAFTVCFLTGLLSHAIQHPPGWFRYPPRPAGLYRVTQGLHVATGIAAVPLLLAKLWSVYPRFFRPVRVDVASLVERVSLVPLVGGAVFMLFTGVTNIARWYVWPFFFPRAHYWAAWITIGALFAHVGARGATARAALRHRANAAGTRRREPGISRRTFLTATGATSLGLVLTTAGQTFSPLRNLVLFAPRRPDIGPQGLPVNKSALDAGVIAAATGSDYRLRVEVDNETRVEFTAAELERLPMHEAALPIACVEGWSATASWRGVRIRDLLARAGVDRVGTGGLDIVSFENGLYGASRLTAAEADDGDTLLALFVNGERLDLDHGYPVRLIGPNRPGVMQTKWVQRVVVR